MKLYEIARNSPLRIELEDGEWDLATFHHVDGAYSYCTTSDGRAFHLAAWTPMVEVDGRWEIDQNPKNS